MKRYLKLKENFQVMVESPKSNGYEWTFYLSMVAFCAFVLLSWTFFPGFVSGIFAGLAIDSAYLAYRTLLEYK
jgi:hypothetical protein